MAFCNAIRTVSLIWREDGTENPLLSECISSLKFCVLFRLSKLSKLEIQCRLDFFLISSDFCDINLADIFPGNITDHSMILLKIALQYNPRWRGFWKLNTSLLKEEEYLNLVYTTQVNSAFRALWLASSEVINQVLFTSEQPKKNKMASRCK